MHKFTEDFMYKMTQETSEGTLFGNHFQAMAYLNREGYLFKDKHNINVGVVVYYYISKDDYCAIIPLCDPGGIVYLKVYATEDNSRWQYDVVNSTIYYNAIRNT